MARRVYLQEDTDVSDNARQQTKDKQQNISEVYLHRDTAVSGNARQKGQQTRNTSSTSARKQRYPATPDKKNNRQDIPTVNLQEDSGIRQHQAKRITDKIYQQYICKDTAVSGNARRKKTAVSGNARRKGQQTRYISSTSTRRQQYLATPAEKDNIQDISEPHLHRCIWHS